MALCINLWLLKTPFFARRPKHHPHPAAFRRSRTSQGPPLVYFWAHFAGRKKPSPHSTLSAKRAIIPFSPIPEDRGRRDSTGHPLNAFRSTKPPYPQLRRSRIRGLQVRGRIQRVTCRVPVRATGLSITPCSAILPRRRSQSKESGSCTRPSSPRPSRPGSYAPREGRGPGR